MTAPLVSVTLRDVEGTAIAPNANGWFNQAVVVDFECTDPVSGDVASGVPNGACPADFTLGEGAHAASPYSVIDVAGNSTSGSVPAVAIDLTAPSVTVTGLDAGTYVVGAAPTPGCTTTDGLSGVATSAAVAVSGPGGGVGLFTASCAGAVDRAGNAADSVSMTFVMGYGVAGYFQPINGAGTPPSAFKKGSTIPVKFALLDASGQRIPDAAARAIADECQATLAWGAGSTVPSTPLEPGSSNPANDGNCFRYEGGQFVFNLGTKAFTTGTWTLYTRVEVGGAVVASHQAPIVLR